MSHGAAMSRRSRIAIWIALGFGALLAIPIGLVAFGFFKVFYIPAEAMMPTLQVNDRLLASLQRPADLRRGDIILLRVGRSIYIKRVAALAGDRIEMIGGIVYLNRRPVTQRYLRTDRIDDDRYDDRARRLAEQFPGEAASHEIYDLGYTQGDDMPEQVVAPGHVFVLGDNRDASADSRFSHAEQGVEQLPIADIRGRALYYLWGPSGRFGDPIGR
jgi:signal peptidase I